MPSISPLHLSGSTSGRQIKITATTTGTGVTLHTSTNVANGYDDVWLEAYNSDTVSRTLTLQLGGTTQPDDEVAITIPPKQGLFAVLAGRRFNGGVVIKGWADAANVITVGGVVQRYAP
jgi:hypothetical protein